MDRPRKYQFDDPGDGFTEAEKRIQRALQSGATGLDLKELGLAEVPGTVGQLTQIRHLWLHENKLKSLPESLRQLSMLEQIGLSFNQLAVLPEWVGRMVHLRKLYLTGNEIAVVPDWIGHLTELEDLFLSGNQLKTLPESIGQLAGLKVLTLMRNQLEQLPTAFSKLLALKELYLHENPALGFPAEVLGPNYDDVHVKNGKPAKPSDVLAFYFSKQVGRPQDKSAGVNLRKRTQPSREWAARLFYSYSHKDASFREELETHLKPLQRTGLISEWHDRKIEAGDDWAGQIDENLESADIILLLVSADFIASDYCYEKEMKRALERHAEGKARVIPVIVRDVNWKHAPFANLQALPKDGLAVMKWTDRDSAWRNVSEGIESVVEKVRRMQHQ